MPKLPKAVEVAGVTAVNLRRKQPVLSRKWLRDAVAANRSAFVTSGSWNVLRWCISSVMAGA